ncbi:glycosyltransferase [Allocoleopsis franciscana]|uniref:Putative glycosyltransferase n=1 Tax=Allocoleopsis franciscana PCC 7113 TaxID=1173027 RepID=K9WMB9_9CYAN|nr:glycosyltransferase [Allocoleopsis franciscana]AFZ20924.1 putative glycosyltransferase [Allocoleopsis franciscana PCC 7113]
MIYFLTVNYYSTRLIARLIDSIPATQTIPHQIVVVNNSANDQELKDLYTESLQILDAQTNLGFGKACNLGLNWIYERNPNAIVWMINPDTYLPENTLKKVSPFFNAHPELSIVGTLIYTPAAELWFAGGQFIPKLGAILSTDLLSSHPDTAYVFCDWVSGCSLLINLRHFPECPQFDPAYFLYYEDFDFCRRYAMQGHQIAVTSQFAVVHEASAIANRNMTKKLKHSTYSYLLTLERYTNKAIFILRFLRLTLYSFILLLLKPQTALGKLAGISSYLFEKFSNDQ